MNRDKSSPSVPHRRSALGKGLHSLLGDLEDIPPPPKSDVGGTSTKTSHQSARHSAAHESVFMVNITEIEPNPNQPRKIFKEGELKSLAESIKHDGVLQPIIVSKTDHSKKYMIVAGERRWRASALAGLMQIPVIIREISSNDLLRLALIENIQRQDLNIIEEAEAYRALIDDYGLTQEQCSAKVGKDRATIANLLRLLNLPKEIQDDLIEARLTMGHGRALLALPSSEKMLRAKDIVLKKQLNVRQTEILCKDFEKAKDQPDAIDPNIEYIAENLKDLLKTKVKIVGSSQKGKIEISFYTQDELDRLLNKMRGAFT